MARWSRDGCLTSTKDTRRHESKCRLLCSLRALSNARPSSQLEILALSAGSCNTSGTVDKYITTPPARVFRDTSRERSRRSQLDAPSGCTSTFRVAYTRILDFALGYLSMSVVKSAAWRVQGGFTTILPRGSGL